MQDKFIKILELLNQKNNLSQRELAKNTGFSLGNVNYIIKCLVKQGYLNCNKVEKKILYNLTDKGLDLIGIYLKTVKRKKISLHTENKQIKQAVILAAGKTSDFDKPICFLRIEKITLIERTVELLFAQNVEKIIIVIGFEDKYFNKFKDDNRILLVKNNKYKWTGTMHSLSLVSNLVDDDFMLIESDVIFEERTLSYLLENDSRDCILITNESGSGDEAFVEIRDGYIYKMSKDIHQLNKIDGEMIGITKISCEVFNMMLEEFKNNRNPYLNYEYLLMDVGRNYKIGYVKIDDLVWFEIDNLKQYESVVKNIFPRMKRKEDNIRFERIQKIISEVLKVKLNEIRNIQPIGGMTNKNYKVTVKGEEFVLRLPGAGTSEMILRTDEKLNSKLAYKNNLDTEIIYFDEQSGIKVSRFIKNTETLNITTSKKEENMKLIVGILKKLHTSGIKFNNRFDVFNLILIYESLLEKYNGKNFEDYNIVRKTIMSIEQLMKKLDIVEVACHNDTVPENFIKSGDKKVYLIDWEYSGMNDPMWDIAAHFIECSFSEDEEELFLSMYFGMNVEEKFKIRILINKILQDFLWSIWTNVKEAKGDNFGTYGIDRYNRAKKNLQELQCIIELN